jgi:protein TonB
MNAGIRYFGVSAALHAAVGVLVLAMVREAPSGLAFPVPTVEVTLVSMQRDTEPAAPLSRVQPSSSPGDESAQPASASRVLFAPIDAPSAPANIDDAAMDPWAVDEPVATAQPRFDDVAAADGGDPSRFLESDLGIEVGPSDAESRADDGASVWAWLEKQKRYPRVALQRRIEGEVTLDLVLDPSGRVREANIVRSSGHRSLDDEVTRMVARAQPFPMGSRAHTGLGEYRIVIEFRLEEL